MEFFGKIAEVFGVGGNSVGSCIKRLLVLFESNAAAIGNLEKTVAVLEKEGFGKGMIKEALPVAVSQYFDIEINKLEQNPHFSPGECKEYKAGFEARKKKILNKIGRLFG